MQTRSAPVPAVFGDLAVTATRGSASGVALSTVLPLALLEWLGVLEQLLPCGMKEGAVLDEHSDKSRTILTSTD